MAYFSFMSWWEFSRRITVAARLAVPTDRPAIASLLANTWRRHGAPAVEEQITLLSSGVSTVAFARDTAVGFLGLFGRVPAGEPAERWIDIALLAIAADRPAGPIMRSLLEPTLSVLREHEATGLVCLAGDSWLRDTLQEAGFVEMDQVISYVHVRRRALPASAHVAILRRAIPADAETLLQLNAAAFAPLWRYDPATMLHWLLTSEHAILAELDGRPAGFALTTRNTSGEYAQLIRVAVDPTAQGRGIARQMVADAVRYAHECGAPGLALNTQASNSVSRHLYEALEFRRTGPSVAVMVRVL
jgi:ribosomal protein S18 acetylase RimI-like enzyme